MKRAIAILMILGLALALGGCTEKYYESIAKINEVWANNQRYLEVETKDGTKIKVPMHMGGPVMPQSPGQDFATGAAAVAPAAVAGMGFQALSDVGKAGISAAKGNNSTISTAGDGSGVNSAGGNVGSPTTTVSPTSTTTTTTTGVEPVPTQ